ncbi:MAG: hypothetical protein GY860_12645, partial [Desulfobacteraceae bacterium]|nr:hypothetical protein [Desulfobacteraceae bacterium]
MSLDQKNAKKRIIELEKMNENLKVQIRENKITNKIKRAARKDWEKTV